MWLGPGVLALTNSGYFGVHIGGGWREARPDLPEQLLILHGVDHVDGELARISERHRWSRLAVEAVAEQGAPLLHVDVCEGLAHLGLVAPRMLGERLRVSLQAHAVGSEADLRQRLQRRLDEHSIRGLPLLQPVAVPRRLQSLQRLRRLHRVEDEVRRGHRLLKCQGWRLRAQCPSRRGARGVLGADAQDAEHAEMPSRVGGCRSAFHSTTNFAVNEGVSVAPAQTP